MRIHQLAIQHGLRRMPVPKPIDPHLVMKLPFVEGSGSIISDESPSENNATLNGPSWTLGKHGRAVNFDGVDDYIDCGNDTSLRFTTEGSWLFWVKPNTGYGEVYPYLLAHHIGTRLYAYFDPSSGKLIVILTTSAGDADVVSASVITVNSWTFLVITYDGNYLKLYVNATLDKTSSKKTGTINTTTQNLYIGNNYIGTRTFSGLMANISIYNRALKSDEVTALYLQGL